MSIETIKDISNREFIERYAKPGCIGLVGADTPIDNSIKKMQKYITADGTSSLWSHAFIYSSKRHDGHWWIIESDLEIHRKQMRLGVQENRAEKYFDEKHFPNLAILDLNLDDAKQTIVLGEALNLVNARTEYSIREVFGALFTMLKKESRGSENKLARDNSLFCSAMVQHCYSKLDLILSEGISLKQLAPEDIATTKIPHTQYRLVRKTL
jgi:hypothetical protein